MEQFLAADEDVKEDGQVDVDFFGRPVILTRKGGKIYAYVNVCTHTGGPVKRDGGCFKCTWHGSTFDVESGKALTLPAEIGSKLTSIPVKVKDGKIYYVYP
ncbi:Rieske (2Fe-2S) protein [Candidatus Micrarchaeota archaeon]|nr:Rieske (2Fe-2S) protein [Candidatus Micrarchaeota archaeon]